MADRTVTLPRHLLLLLLPADATRLGARAQRTLGPAAVAGKFVPRAVKVVTAGPRRMVAGSRLCTVGGWRSVMFRGGVAGKVAPPSKEIERL